MKRLAFRMKLFKGSEEEYRRRHDALWPELKDCLKKAGIMEYSIFLDPETCDLFGFMKVTDEEQLDRLSDQPVMQKWWVYMKDLMETGPGDVPVTVALQEVFYLP